MRTINCHKGGGCSQVGSRGIDCTLDGVNVRSIKRGMIVIYDAQRLRVSKYWGARACAAAAGGQRFREKSSKFVANANDTITTKRLVQQGMYRMYIICCTSLVS